MTRVAVSGSFVNDCRLYNYILWDSFSKQNGKEECRSSSAGSGRFAELLAGAGENQTDQDTEQQVPAPGPGEQHEFQVR